jgi:hypothetical protein
MTMRYERDHLAMLDGAKAWRKIKATRKQLWNDWTRRVGCAFTKARSEATTRARGSGPN